MSIEENEIIKSGAIDHNVCTHARTHARILSHTESLTTSGWQATAIVTRGSRQTLERRATARLAESRRNTGKSSDGNSRTK